MVVCRYRFDVRPLTRVRQLAFPVIVAAMLMSACSGSDPTDSGRFAGSDLPIPLAKPDIVLTDTDGNPFDLRAETEGRLTLVYFGYTNCPDICPVHLAQITQVLDRPSMPTDVAVVFITVDPERDDPRTIRRFLDNYDAAYVGLTGTHDQLDAAQISFDVPLAQREGDDDHDDHDHDYTIGHAGQVFAFARDGFAYSVYPQGTRQSHWVRDLVILAAIPVRGPSGPVSAANNEREIVPSQPTAVTTG